MLRIICNSFQSNPMPAFTCIQEQIQVLPFPGLQLYLQTRRTNMLPLYARRLGARVTIHDPRSLPFSRESGFDLRHRDLHSLSIRDQEVHRLGPPFGRCGKDGDNETSSYQEKPYNQIVRLWIHERLFFSRQRVKK